MKFLLLLGKVSQQPCKLVNYHLLDIPDWLNAIIICIVAELFCLFSTDEEGDDDDDDEGEEDEEDEEGEGETFFTVKF